MVVKSIEGLNSSLKSDNQEIQMVIYTFYSDSYNKYKNNESGQTIIRVSEGFKAGKKMLTRRKSQ